MWSFAAAPGSPPLPKETPLSGYLPGNPVPAEQSWMEPRQSTVPRRDGTELCVLPSEPRAQGSGNAPGGSQRPHKAVPNPCPCVAPNLPQKHLLSSASNALSVEGTLQKHSGTTTTTAEALMGHHHPACWSHTHPTQPWTLGPRVSQPSLVLEQEDRLPQER